MKGKRLGSLGIAFAVCALLAGPALAEDPVAGVVIDVKGKPQVSRKGSDKWKRLKLNRYVYEEDTIKTKKGERVAIAFIGGAEVRVNESSEFVVNSGGGNKRTSIFSKVGQAWTRMLHGRAGLDVRTPVGVAAVRGTEADVDIHDRMTVKVYEGHVNVNNQYGSQALTAGMMTNVAAGGAPAAPRAMSAGDYGSWHNSLKPKNIEGRLKKLHKKAGQKRDIKLKFKTKDGKTKELNIKLEKK
jgi:hypothetical protein